MVIKFREVLAATEKLEPAAMREYQQNLLRPLLAHARRNVPFYENRLDKVFRGNEVDFSRWHDIPILTRADAQLHFEALKARKLPPQMGPVSGGETSGSTGRPVRYLKNRLASIAELAMTDRLYRWWGMDGNKTLGMLVSKRVKADPGMMFGAWRSGFTDGKQVRFNEWSDPHELVKWLLQNNVAYLCADAGMQKGISPAMIDIGVLAHLDLMISRGSKLSAEIRKDVLAAFGCRTVDTYGGDEIGHIANECPECGAYHIGAEALFVEILNGAGSPSAPGERGRVVCTSLYNYAFPLIRYDLADYATLATTPVQCATKLPLLSDIWGRFHNTFVRPDGNIVFPYVDLALMQEMLGCRQFQVVQHSTDDIEVNYVATDVAGSTDLRRLNEHMRETLWPTVKVRASRTHSIADETTGKYQDFKCLLRRSERVRT